jgi:hypothetical protein
MGRQGNNNIWESPIYYTCERPKIFEWRGNGYSPTPVPSHKRGGEKVKKTGIASFARNPCFFILPRGRKKQFQITKGQNS